MKNILILASIILWTIGGFAMNNKDEIRKKLVKDAQDKELITPLEEVRFVLKTTLFEKGFTQKEIIDFALAYSFQYQKNVVNLLDSELRSIANLKEMYFDRDYLKKQKEIINSSIFENILSWLKWILIGAGGLIAGTVASNFVRKNKA